MARHRTWLALCLAAGVALVLLPISGASTGSVRVPATIIGHSEVHVTGAALASVDHTLSANGSTIVDSEIGFLGKPKDESVDVRVGGGVWTSCDRDDSAKTPNGKVTEYRCIGLNRPSSNAEVWIVADDD